MSNNEKIYIAGPECLYTNGYKIWNSLREKAEINGCVVTLPNDVNFDFTQDDRRKIADDIFNNCANSMNHSTAILANLEAFRSVEPDSGSIYELGMAYAQRIKCYGYTRDKRSMSWKNHKAFFREGTLYDEAGRIHPYSDLPFSPLIIASTKIVEGDFDDCLSIFLIDSEEELKTGKSQIRNNFIDKPSYPVEKNTVYLSGPERYDLDSVSRYDSMKQICRSHGLNPITPIDHLDIDEDSGELNPFIRSMYQLKKSSIQIQKSDIVIANLNDFRGWEPSNDTAFECGMSFQLGKKLYGYMDDTSRMIDRIPNYISEQDFKDECGNIVENFDYPINLMFASSMTIFEGSFETIIELVVSDIENNL